MTTPLAAATPLEFVPSQPFRFVTALVLAVLIHILVLLGLASGPHARHKPQPTILQAVLLPASTDQAIPGPVEPPPLAETPVVPEPSNQETSNAQEKAEQPPPRRDTQAGPEQQGRAKPCLSPEEMTMRDASPTSDRTRNDGRVPCVEG